MKRTIVSLALLKARWETDRTDYVDTFLPFLGTLHARHQYSTLDPSQLTSDFLEDFGLVVPFHPMVTLLNRARRRGLVSRSHGTVLPDAKLKELDFSAEAQDQQRRYESVLERVIKYAQSEYNVSLTPEAANDAIIGYFKSHDVDLIMTEHFRSALPEIESSRRMRFLISSFIHDAHLKHPQLFDYLLSIAVGNVVANALVSPGVKAVKGSLRRLEIFLDTGFILRLLGIGGSQRADAYGALLVDFRRRGARLRVFHATHDEAIGILEGAKKHIDSPAYNPARASAALRYFVAESYSRSDVQLFISSFEDRLNRFDITVEPNVSPQIFQDHQIDEEMLFKTIATTYEASRSYFDEVEMAHTLNRDSHVLGMIYRLRRGRRPRRLRDAGVLFVTTNSSLAIAVNKFETVDQDSVRIPACLTDVFVGTILWLDSPAQTALVNRRRLIADCYAALKPDRMLLRRFVAEVDSLRKKGDLSDDAYFLMRTDTVAQNLLMKKTLSDPDAVTTKTVAEIRDEMRDRIQAEGLRAVAEERTRHEDTLARLEVAHASESALRNRIRSFSTVCGNVSSWMLFISVHGLLFWGFLESVMPRIEIGLAGALAVALSLLTSVDGFNLVDVRTLLSSWISKTIQRFSSRLLAIPRE